LVHHFCCSFVAIIILWLRSIQVIGLQLQFLTASRIKHTFSNRRLIFPSDLKIYAITYSDTFKITAFDRIVFFRKFDINLEFFSLITCRLFIFESIFRCKLALWFLLAQLFILDGSAKTSFILINTVSLHMSTYLCSFARIYFGRSDVHVHSCIFRFLTRILEQNAATFICLVFSADGKLHAVFIHDTGLVAGAGCVNLVCEGFGDFVGGGFKTGGFFKLYPISRSPLAIRIVLTRSLPSYSSTCLPFDLISTMDLFMCTHNSILAWIHFWRRNIHIISRIRRFRTRFFKQDAFTFILVIFPTNCKLNTVFIHNAGKVTQVRCILFI
jgi:hypothetical protein